MSADKDRGIRRIKQKRTKEMKRESQCPARRGSASAACVAAQDGRQGQGQVGLSQTPRRPEGRRPEAEVQLKAVSSQSDAAQPDAPHPARRSLAALCRWRGDPEADVAGRGLDGVGAARSDAVAVAVRVVAQERAAAQRPRWPPSSASAHHSQTLPQTLKRPKPLARRCGRRSARAASRPAARSGTRRERRCSAARRRRRAVRRPRRSAALRGRRAPRAPIRLRSAGACRPRRSTPSHRSRTRARPDGRRDHGRASPAPRGAAMTHPPPAATTAGRHHGRRRGPRRRRHLQVEDERAAEALGIGDVARGADEGGELGVGDGGGGDAEGVERHRAHRALAVARNGGGVVVAHAEGAGGDLAPGA